MTGSYHPPRSDEWAWAAGIFEGEGSISVNAKDQAWQLRVEMTDEDVVRRFHEVLNCGTVGGPYVRRNNKPSWVWRIKAQSDTAHVLMLFMPYLGKRRKAKALEALASITPRLYGRQALAEEAGL